MERIILEYNGCTLNQQSNTFSFGGTDAFQKMYETRMTIEKFREIVSWANKKFKEMDESQTVCQGIGE